MRHLPLALLASFALLLASCTGDDDDTAPGGSSGSGAMAGENGSDEGGASSSTGGTGGRGGLPAGGGEFTDLPGKLRFINFVSDGTDGVNLDLYWGTTLSRSELAGTVEYGEITEFFTPRHLVSPVLEADEARFFLVPEGDVSGSPSSFLVLDSHHFQADTVLTVAMAARSGVGTTNPYVVSAQTFYESELSTPPAGMAHVFGWASAFDQIEDGDFVLVGADGLCDPELGDSGGANLGAPALVPESAAGLTLFDANTECASGATPVTEGVVAGHSYVLLGQADTYDVDARRSVLLEIGTEN